VVELFQAWGITVNRSLVVVVEVKTTLRVGDVRAVLEDLKKFPNFFPEYRGYRLFRAVAALATNDATPIARGCSC